MAVRRQTKKKHGGGKKRREHLNKGTDFPPKQRSSSSHKSASDSDSLHYGPMSETESQIELKPYDKLTPSSEGSVTPPAKHDQEESYLEQLIESSGVDKKAFIKHLKNLNTKNINSINTFFKGNFKVPDRGPEYLRMVDLLDDPRINDLVCEAALMKE